MNNNLIALMTTALVADIIISYDQNCAIEEQSLTLAERLFEEGIDLDFVLVIAGANKSNLKEVSELAFEELVRLAKLNIANPEEVSRYVSSNNGNKR